MVTIVHQTITLLMCVHTNRKERVEAVAKAKAAREAKRNAVITSLLYSTRFSSCILIRNYFVEHSCSHWFVLFVIELQVL
jgi:hypothetical protein